ncbi:MAG: 2-phosphosulfolactate phosphatase [Verrucomicrobiota bacterium]|nr:2-phosphosulfolactate phosphatase [Verrucomicrobiota bacterium]
MTNVETLFTPAEFSLLPQRDLSRTVCVVFDVLRATSTIITALAHGAAGVIPVSEISEALAVRERTPDVLLAGEREGLRISDEFEFGNSPREFTSERVHGKTIVTTTTNGTRALRSCAHAQQVLVGSFLNLSATVKQLRTMTADSLLLVCGGTFERAAYEDVLCAGAVADCFDLPRDDSTLLARNAYRGVANDLLGALHEAENGKRLRARLELADDVPFCATVDRFDIVAVMDSAGRITVAPSS